MMAKKPLMPTEEEKVLVARKLLDNPLLTFVPSGKQDLFLKSDAFVQVFSGANWTGKTTALVVKLANYIWKPKQKFLDFPYLNEMRKRFRARIISTPTNIEQMFIPEMKKWFPKGRYTARKGNKSFEYQWQTDTGVVIDIMTYEQKPEEFESIKLDLAIFDEPPPEAIYNATVARMRPKGKILIGLTPLSQAAWIFDRLDNPFKTRNWDVFYVDIEAVCIEHGLNGILHHEDIEKKIEEYDEDEKEARIHGKPMHLAGLVYKNWHRKKHVVEPFEVPGDWTRTCVVDPHDRKPFAIAWFCTSPTGKHYLYDEYPNEAFHEIKTSSKVVKEYAEIIREKEKGQKIETRIIDARYGNRQSSQTSKTIRDLFDEEDLIFENSYTEDKANLDSGHQAVKELLKEGADGEPTFRVFKNCLNAIYGFEHYIWDDHRQAEKGLKEKPKEFGKDFMDLVRYYAKSDPEYVEPLVERPYHTDISYYHAV